MPLCSRRVRSRLSKQNNERVCFVTFQCVKPSNCRDLLPVRLQKFDKALIIAQRILGAKEWAKIPSPNGHVSVLGTWVHLGSGTSRRQPLHRGWWCQCKMVRERGVTPLSRPILRLDDGSHQMERRGAISIVPINLHTERDDKIHP